MTTGKTIALTESRLVVYCIWRRRDRMVIDKSHEIERRLFLRRKVMTNLDSIFKSRDITLPTKAHVWM